MDTLKLVLSLQLNCEGNGRNGGWGVLEVGIYVLMIFKTANIRKR